MSESALKEKIEAATFRKIIKHLQDNKESPKYRFNELSRLL